jgi:integrase
MLTPKTKASYRTLPLSSLMLAGLAKLAASFPERESKDFIFFGGLEPIGRTTVRRVFSSHISLAKVPHIRFHDIRHYVTTELIRRCKSTADVKAVDYWLGRRSTDVTLGTYFHERADDVIAISKSDELK